MAIKETTFQAALPYGVGTLAVGAAGAALALTAASTALTVVGVATAFFGAYAFLGVISCGLLHAGNPEGFRQNIGKHMVTAGGTAIAEMIALVARIVLEKLVDDCLRGKRRTV